MTLRHTRPAALAVIAVVLLVGCSGKKASDRASNSGSTSVVDQVKAAVNALTTVHLDTDTGTTKGTADVAMSKGTVTALRVSTTQDGVAYQTVTVGTATYLKLNSPVDGKNWAAVSLTSTIPQVKVAASPLSNVGITTLLASPGTVSVLLNAAGDLTQVEPGHYKLSVDPTKVDASSGIGQIFSLLGSKPIPVELWVNGKSQPTKLSFAVTLLGSARTVSVVLSDFDAPLSINPPAAADVTRS